MCGQVFCNQCSSYYIERDDATQARTCRLCYEQLGHGFADNKQYQKRRITSKKFTDLSLNEATLREETERSVSSADSKPHSVISTMPSMDGTIRLFETPESRDRHVSNLQNRASQHLESIVDLLVRMAPNIELEQKSVWKGIIVQLVREVVAFVDPDVRAGDSLDIRPYVKLKIIPGGTLQDNAFVNGVVFRKNVAHKKMSAPRTNPRILLLGGGIDFQREDCRLSSLETLIEQEDRYTEILVDKILTLKPNVILVGKSVARRAQEMLCEKNVVVMQSVKATLLERIARMTGAIVLPSTDHMIQQYGEECLGSCEKFRLRKIIDCEWDEFMPKKRSTPLKRITKDQQGVTYAFLEGCPAELGGTIILRGAGRKVLSEVKRIISFGIMLAYHLRLEVSYYTDRCARLPDALDVTKSEYESDDEHVEPSLLIKPSVTDEDAKRFMCHILSEAEQRSLLSTSLDVDITLPHSTDVRGTPSNVYLKAPIDSVTPEDYQTLLVTSLVMTHNFVQRSRAEVKGIRYYTAQDVALGQFLVESCFQLPSLRSSGRIMMLDHILSFVHRTGRIDISVSRVGGSDVGPADNFDSQAPPRDPLQTPIMMHSFCKECKAIVTPDVFLSDETWKMSFGKFMEMNFYNRSARCRTGGCAHYIRDDHVLFFLCEGYSARFEFVPIHPYSLHVRYKSLLPTDFHDAVTLNFLNEYSLLSDRLFNDFAQVLASLERLVTDVLGARSEVLNLALGDIKMIETDIQTTLEDQQEVINSVMDLMSGGRTSLCNDDSLPDIIYSFPKKFPLRLRRELLQKATNWNAKIDVVYRFIDSLESMNQAAAAAQQQANPTGTHSISELPDDDELMNLRSSLMQMSVTDIGEEEDPTRDAQEDHPHGDDFQEKRPLIKGSGNEDKRASTRIVKAFARLLGKDNFKQSNFAVDISDFSGGRLGLPPGRGGRVIGVVEDELSTVIAYSLSSQEYWDQVQAFLREDTNDLIVKERPYKNNEILSSPADFEQSNENDMGGNQMESKIDYPDELTLDSQRERSETDPMKTLGDSHNNPDSSSSVPKKRKSTFAKTFQTLVKSDTPEPQATASVKEGTEQEETESENPEGMFGFMSFHSTGDYFEYGDEYVIGGLGSNADGESDNGAAPQLSSIQEASSSDNEKEPNGPATGEPTSPQPISRESILTDRRKTHIKHRFSDFDDKNNIMCKFISTIYWAVQFAALRAEFLDDDDDEGFIRSLSLSSRWNAQGGKSGASFSRTTDNRFVVKHITRTELQMFLEFAPAYFDYMAKAFYHGLPTTLCKILGVYQIGYHNRATGKKVMEQVVVMENLFFEVTLIPLSLCFSPLSFSLPQRNITNLFDLKGSSRARYVDILAENGEKADDFDTVLSLSLSLSLSY
jgi:hypothetical protein